MSMCAFWQMFPDLARGETRSLSIPRGHPVPPDDYAFLEFYCVDPGCDCRRVIISVLPNHGGQPVATINHAFDPENADDLAGQTFLDPLNPQSEFACDLLGVFLEVIRVDPAYLARLERHYQIVKDAVRDPGHPVHRELPPGATGGPPLTWPAQRKDSRPKPRRTDPCPCGSGRMYKRCCGGRGTA